MMILGGPRQGERLLLGVLCQNPGTLAALAPQSAPWATIYGGPDDVRFSFRIQAADRIEAPGLFARTIHVDGRFRPGRYGVRFVFPDAAGSPRVSLAVFTVPEGGHPDGTIIALYPFVTGPNVFLVKQHDSGKLTKGRNPSV